MDEYKKPYLILWGGCTEALEALEHQNYGQAGSFSSRPSRRRRKPTSGKNKRARRVGGRFFTQKAASPWAGRLNMFRRSDPEIRSTCARRRWPDPHQRRW